MKIVLCQLNNILGDIELNANKIISSLEKYRDHDLLVFPELFLTGYPLLDLVANPEFRDKVGYFIEKILEQSKKFKTALLFGVPIWQSKEIYNAAILIKNGKIIGQVCKSHLPNYGVFNEARNFISADSRNQPILTLENHKIALLICEDMWFDDVITNYVKEQPDLIIAINASPFDLEKENNRKTKAQKIIAICKKPLLYINLFGAQDDLVFDGGSFAMSSDAQYLMEPQSWQEKYFHFIYSHNELVQGSIDSFDNEAESCKNHRAIINNNAGTEDNFVIECDFKGEARGAYLDVREQAESCKNHRAIAKLSSVYQALMLAIKDYTSKNKFNKCILGLSGGIDSALVAVIVADAIGGDRLHAVMMPSKFTSEESLVDANALACNIGCKYDVINIDKINNDFLSLLSPLFHGYEADVTEENLQARIRGVILMSMANKFKSMLVATSNKSEAAMGYATLYGDMCGSFSLIKDLYKTTVYSLANWRNDNIPLNSKLKLKNIIPSNIIKREPSAELNFNQKDSDSLPPYDLLDKILFQLIEEDSSCQQVANNLNLDLKLVQNIKNKLIKNEFKRAQSALGPKITTKTLGIERKYPITIYNS